MAGNQPWSLPWNLLLCCWHLLFCCVFTQNQKRHWLLLMMWTYEHTRCTYLANRTFTDFFFAQ